MAPLLFYATRTQAFSQAAQTFTSGFAGERAVGDSQGWSFQAERVSGNDGDAVFADELLDDLHWGNGSAGADEKVKGASGFGGLDEISEAGEGLKDHSADVNDFGKFLVAVSDACFESAEGGVLGDDGRADLKGVENFVDRFV